MVLMLEWVKFSSLFIFIERHNQVQRKPSNKEMASPLSVACSGLRGKDICRYMEVTKSQFLYMYKGYCMNVCVCNNTIIINYYVVVSWLAGM